MLLKILDALGVQQTIVAAGQATPTDRSGAIAATGASQMVMDANAFRSGWLFQNRSANPMYVLETGADAAVSGPAFAVPPGTCFPPAGFPVTTSKVTVLGTAGDAFSAREW